jgi:putative transposase
MAFFMTMEDIYYRRNLPHYHLDSYPFITFRLAGSLPLEVLAQLKSEREVERATLKNKTLENCYEIEKRYFDRFDDWLDRYTAGPRWLQVENIAQIVMKEIHSLNGSRYELMTYCITPNHVHLLIESLVGEQANHCGRSAKYPVTDTLRLLKGTTARACNLELKRTGNFWQHESYDHVVRDKQELDRIVLYVLNNPVKARLVNEWKEWNFTYISPELGSW